MEIMVYSLLWVMQDLYHQPYGPRVGSFPAKLCMSEPWHRSTAKRASFRPATSSADFGLFCLVLSGLGFRV